MVTHVKKISCLQKNYTGSVAMQKENTKYKLICSKNSFLTSWCANYMECMPCEQMRNMPMVVILLSDLTHVCHKDILRRNHTLTQSTA